MKLAFAILALVLGLQQQTFYSASAKPKIPPRATAQPVNPDYLYYACIQRHAKNCGQRPKGRQSPRPRPSLRPGPHHT